MKKEIISIKEDVFIKQKGENVVLQKGDKIRVLEGFHTEEDLWDAVDNYTAITFSSMGFVIKNFDENIIVTFTSISSPSIIAKVLTSFPLYMLENYNVSFRKESIVDGTWGKNITFKAKG